MKRKTIPAGVKEDVLQTVERFNQVKLSSSDCRYLARFRGKFLYLDIEDFGQVGRICRLEYKGGKVPWEMAIYKYGSDRYDPENCWFPGNTYVDGTVTGAMKAGLVAFS
jgi:hypothetical protein